MRTPSSPAAASVAALATCRHTAVQGRRLVVWLLRQTSFYAARAASSHPGTRNVEHAAPAPCRRAGASAPPAWVVPTQKRPAAARQAQSKSCTRPQSPAPRAGSPAARRAGAAQVSAAGPQRREQDTRQPTTGTPHNSGIIHTNKCGCSSRAATLAHARIARQKQEGRGAPSPGPPPQTGRRVRPPAAAAGR